MLTEQQINKILEVGLFDYLGNFAWELDKQDIITMFKEFNFAVYELAKGIEKQATNKMIKEIKENYMD